MTDVDRLVVWLREAMDAAERRADRWHDVECDVHAVSLTGAAVLQSATLCDCGGPAAVLRRIAADRKILEAHPTTTEVINPGYGKHVADFGCVTCHDWDGVTEGYGWCDTIRLLAEGYGWTETRSWPECMCTPSGECGNCWEKRQRALNAQATKGESR